MGISDMAGPFGEWRAAAGGTGAALTAGVTAPAAFIQFPPGAQYLAMEGRNFTTAVVIKWLANPWLRVLKTTDALAVAANTTDYSENAQDNSAATDVDLSSMASTSHLWVGAEVPFRGVFFDVDAANATTNTCVTAYYNGTTMTALTSTDGTTAGASSAAVDGGLTWTVPAAWAAGTLRSIAAAHVDVPRSGESLYWVRINWSVAMDTATTMNAVLAMNRSTDYCSRPSGRVAEFLLPTGKGRYGCLEAITDAGTAFLLCTVATAPGGRFG